MPKHKHQFVEISITQDSTLNATTLIIKPNGSIEIPGYWQMDDLDELRNLYWLADSSGNKLAVRKIPPEYSINYTKGMTAEEMVFSSLEYEKEATRDLVTSWETVVYDSIRHFIITRPYVGKKGQDYYLTGAKGGFSYSMHLSSTTFSDENQIEFLKNLFLEN